MRVRLLTFASAADAVGRERTELELPADVQNVEQLKVHLERLHPRLGPLWQRLAIAVDGEVASGRELLSEGCEVALLPPVSGGSDAPETLAYRPPAAQQRLRDAPLDIAAVQRAVEDRRFGAILLFVGTVRDQQDGRKVQSIHYSAYRSMAERRLRVLLEELASEHQARLEIVHRLGDVPAGEASVVIAVASAHREACYAASRAALERLKAEVPIWKREHFADGERVWREVESLA
jgi:molybdopterin synthase catalytic subunit